MTAFDWIEFAAVCPACGLSAKLRAQTHIASSYDGDSTGRFHDRTYQLGEKMTWFSPEDIRGTGWFEAADPGHLPVVREACYGECLSCQAALCVVVEFENVEPSRVVRVDRETDWPNGYSR